MKLIGILIVLAIVGLMSAKLIKGSSAERNAKAQAEVQKAVGDANAAKLPAVPTRPQDVKQFEKDMSKALNDAAKAQVDKAEETAK
jgi:hypothetical protein